MYEVDNEWETTVYLRELYSVLCSNLNGKEIKKKRGNICIPVADSLCYTAETTTTNMVKQL